ncbi:tetratricopeptide repeat protein [Plantactinospora sp. S1510]|uniref:Tetratricopeptide repeat protein n=1 Tax=Plantactinospora alkalitolerans TaxID=2789879 RepID=A0ABS0GXH8_9ACTN|nr:tetratricopeptide repeat protein [Plantactinospora alkalitolerans]MBF9130912.1 tetratricopeptide repeat protein [Plantactinospora alkalitolerans]
MAIGSMGPPGTNDVASFVAALRQLKERSGYTYRQLEERAAHRGDFLARSTIADLLHRQALPRPETLTAFVRACAPTEPVEAWIEARNRLAKTVASPRRPGRSTGPAGPDTATVAHPLVPRQLPAPPSHFVGRAAEMALLNLAADQRSGTGAALSIIGGIGGIGKTSLALRWAHLNLNRFPDGQLYADLRGFGPDTVPVPPETTLRGFLETLGMPAASIPKDWDVAAASFRSLVADRRMLIVLDNARDASQVIPLLPGNQRCVVLVTSRHQMRSLAVTHGAQSLNLERLPDDEARQLLAGHLGRSRLARRPRASDALVEHCGGLPLALAIVVARAATHPRHPLDVLAQELRDASARLDALSTGELRTDLRAVFSWSYQALQPQAAGLFDRLGLVPIADIGLPAASSLVGLPLSRTRELLRELENTSLLTHEVPGRYRMHDLVHTYSVDNAHQRLGRSAREAAARRLVDFYLHTAYGADRILDPRRPALALVQHGRGCVPQRLHSGTEAMTWFDLEHERLIEAQELAMRWGWYNKVWQLARTLVTFHARRRRSRDQIRVWRVALLATEYEEDPAAQALAHRYLGQAYTAEGPFGRDFDHLQTALDCGARAADTAEQARTHYALSVAFDRGGNHEQALTHARQALALFEEVGLQVDEARAHNAVGWISIHLRRYQDAQRSCSQALALFQRHGHPDGEADTLHSLGRIAHRTGDHRRALTHYQQALDRYREVDNTRGQVDSLGSLGELYAILGHYADARRAWEQTLELLRAQRRRTELLALEVRLSTLPPAAARRSVD